MQTEHIRTWCRNHFDAKAFPASHLEMAFRTNLRFSGSLAVFSMAALLVSCQTEEIRVSTFEPGENDVLFSMAYNRADTKSSDDGVPYAKKGYYFGYEEAAR